MRKWERSTLFVFCWIAYIVAVFMDKRETNQEVHLLLVKGGILIRHRYTIRNLTYNSGVQVRGQGYK